jgi:hypothetical protein
VSFDASNSLRHCGQRDDRRRRLLADDLSGPAEGNDGILWRDSGSVPQKSESYGNAEFLERQWRLLDLIPRRLPVLMLLLLLAAGAIAGLEAAYHWMLSRTAGGTPLAALDIGAKGSLACWFSTLTLLAASVAAILIYNVRRHRTDDYQGRYRVWRLAAVCWFLLATDQAASLREAFRDAMIALSGTSLLGDGALWWVAVYVFVLGAVGSRLLLDMRPSLLSMGALTAAAVAYGFALASSLGITIVEGTCGEIMFCAGSEMTGSLMLLAAMAFHARYVVLDAEGLLPRRKREADGEPDEDDSNSEVKVVSSNNTWRAIDPPHATPQPTYQRPATAPATVPASPARVAPSSPASASVPAPVNRKLTKAERKALKERLLRERCQREKW